MHIGQSVLAKVNGVIKECVVKEIFIEDLKLEVLGTQEIINRKWWEVQKLKINNEK